MSAESTPPKRQRKKAKETPEKAPETPDDAVEEEEEILPNIPSYIFNEFTKNYTRFELPKTYNEVWQELRETTADSFELVDFHGRRVRETAEKISINGDLLPWSMRPPTMPTEKPYKLSSKNKRVLITLILLIILCTAWFKVVVAVRFMLSPLYPLKTSISFKVNLAKKPETATCLVNSTATDCSTLVTAPVGLEYHGADGNPFISLRVGNKDVQLNPEAENSELQRRIHELCRTTCSFFAGFLSLPRPIELHICCYERAEGRARTRTLFESKEDRTRLRKMKKQFPNSWRHAKLELGFNLTILNGKNEEQLTATIRHEFCHALGFGFCARWRNFRRLNPRFFVGKQATRAYSAVCSNPGQDSPKVPKISRRRSVPMTEKAHWLVARWPRKCDCKAELMRSKPLPKDPLRIISAVTIAALQDLGVGVDWPAARAAGVKFVPDSKFFPKVPPDKADGK